MVPLPAGAEVWIFLFVFLLFPRVFVVAAPFETAGHDFFQSGRTTRTVAAGVLTNTRSQKTGCRPSLWTLLLAYKAHLYH